MKKLFFLKLFFIIIMDVLLIYLCIKNYPYNNGYPIFLFIFVFISLAFTFRDIGDLLKIYKGKKLIETKIEIKKKVLFITWFFLILFLTMFILIIILGEREDIFEMGIFLLIGLLVCSYYLIVIYERKTKKNQIK